MALCQVRAAEPALDSPATCPNGKSETLLQVTVKRQSEPWARPVLRWAGSKRQMLSSLMAALPARYNRYFEPFAGSAVLFFAIRPERAIISDINGDLIDTYRALKAHPRLVRRRVADIPIDTATYYQWRAREVEGMELMERAVRFVYLNRTCFNGIYRTNRAGGFNVPMGSRVGSLPSEREFYRCSIALRSTDINQADFKESVAMAESGDLVYLDPPYYTDRSTYGEYGYGGYSHGRDMTRLVSSALELHDRGVKVLISYGRGIDDLSKSQGWHTSTVYVRRRIAPRPGDRKPACETLITNYDRPHANGY